MQDSNPKTKKVTAIEEIKPAEIDKNGQLILTEKHKKLIKEQIAPNATPEELQLFLMMAHRTRLDPLLQQLYFIKYGQGDRAKVSYVTSIDGYRIIAHRTGQFAGIDEPKYQMNNSGQLENCTITVYRKDSDRGFSATVYFKEYNTSMNLWAKMPMTMIAKVAEAHALRKAFPQDLSGVYTTDEMDQASIPASIPGENVSAPRPQSQNYTKPTIYAAKASPAQVGLISKLLRDKGKTPHAILTTFGINSLNDIPMAKASDIIKRLSAMPNAQMVQEPAQDAEIVDIDEIDAAMTAEQDQKIKQYKLDESPRATAGEIKLFEIVVKRRALQTKKDYETIVSEICKKLKVNSLIDLSQEQIKTITNKVVEMNKAHESKYNQEAKDVADIVGGEVE